MRDSISVLDKKVNLYKRGKSSYWQAAIKLQNGKWERFSTGTDDETDAKEKALKLFYGAEAKAENKLPQSTRRFRNVAKFTVERMQTELEGGSGIVTYKDYIRVINNYLIPFFGNRDISNINVKLLHEYTDWRDKKMGDEILEKKLVAIKSRATDPKEVAEARKKLQTTFKAKQSTINTHNSALNRVFDEALLHGWITESIKPKLLNKGKKSESRGAFSDEEWNFISFNMWDWSQMGHRQETRELREVMFDYVAFLGHTGVRAGTEAYNLKWKNLSLFNAKDRSKLDYLAVNVDGKRGKRELIAKDVVKSHLARIIDYNPRIRHESVEAAIKAKLDEYVFVNRSGERVTTDALRGAFRLFLEHHNMRVGADGKNRSLYSLRHTYATMALLAGRDIHKLAVQMGTSVEMLEKFYSKVSARMNAAEHAGR